MFDILARKGDVVVSDMRVLNALVCGTEARTGRLEYWWEINEAELLTPFLPFVARQDLDFTIHLPSHTADDVPLPRFTSHIRRRHRQWHYGEVHHDGPLSVRPEAQFPLRDLLERERIPDGEAELEAEERAQWRDRADANLMMSWCFESLDLLR